MKKVLAILFIMLLTCDGVLARSVMVKFNNAGVRTSITHGAGSVNRFGRNAAFTPRNRVLAGQRLRARRYDRAMINALNNMGQRTININNNVASSASQVSRFDRNYTVQKQTSYTRGGVTYYN